MAAGDLGVVRVRLGGRVRPALVTACGDFEPRELARMFERRLHGRRVRAAAVRGNVLVFPSRSSRPTTTARGEVLDVINDIRQIRTWNDDCARHIAALQFAIDGTGPPPTPSATKRL